MTATWGAEPSGHSNTDLRAELKDPAIPDADLRGQAMTLEQWETAEIVDVTGEWL